MRDRGLVFLVAVVVRLIAVASIHDLPIVRTPKLDSFEYVSWARRLASGIFESPAISAHGPGYPVFLAALFALGASITLALIVQSLLGAATAVFVSMLAERWFGRRAALYAGMLYAILGPVVYVETALLGEGLLLLLLVAGTLLLTEPTTGVRTTFAGVLLGFSILVRPTAALVIGALLVAFWHTVERARRSALVFAFIGGVAVVTVPAVLHNWATSRTLGIQGFGGLNFYIGNSPTHTGRPTFRLGAGWDGLNSEAHRLGIEAAAAQDAYYLRKTLAEIREHPVRFLRLLGVKALWVVQADEVRDSHSFYFFADRSLALRVLPRMALLIPLAAVGLLESVRRRRNAVLLDACAIGAALTVVFFVMGTRYRIPIAPAFAIWGGLGVDALVESAREWRYRELALNGAAILAAIVVSHVLSDASSRNVAEEWAFTGSSLVTEHRLDDAEAAYRKALALDPRSALAWDGLGLTMIDDGRWSEARAALLKSAQLESESSRSSYHVGLVDEHDGRLGDAIVEYRHSTNLDPTNLDASRHLAAVLIRLHRDADAIPVLSAIVGHAPSDAEAHRTLAGALAGTGRLSEAKSELLKSLNLTPRNGDAWVDLCLISLDLGATEDAVAALERARTLGAPLERLQFATGAVEARRELRR